MELLSEIPPVRVRGFNSAGKKQSTFITLLHKQSDLIASVTGDPGIVCAFLDASERNFLRLFFSSSYNPRQSIILDRTPHPAAYMARKGDRTNSLENSFSLLTFREDTVRLAVGEKNQGQRTF